MASNTRVRFMLPDYTILTGRIVKRVFSLEYVCAYEITGDNGKSYIVADDDTSPIR